MVGCKSLECCQNHGIDKIEENNHIEADGSSDSDHCSSLLQPRASTNMLTNSSSTFQTSTSAATSSVHSPCSSLVPKSGTLLGSHGADDLFEDSQFPLYRDPVILREQVLLQLRRIIDPDLYKDIVSLGFVKDLQIDYDTSTVSFTLELTTPACPVKDMFVDEAERLLKELEWIENVKIELTAKTSGALPGNAFVNLSGVSTIIAVASCKGGVGKSSVACNMAYMLAMLGARVGLVDADVYGPSLPLLIGLESPKVYFASTSEQQNSTRPNGTLRYENSNVATGNPEASQTKESMQKALATGEGGLVPLSFAGVKLMSYGYLKTSDFAAVRGPIASNVVYQMVTQTLWGDLDYLLIDMPPGTGDIHLTVAQSVPVTAAVMITTPQQLSLADVEKGILMFNKLNIPTIAIVENMSCFVCPCCQAAHDIFSHVFKSNRPENVTTGSADNDVTEVQTTLEEYCNVNRLVDQFGITIRAEIPIHPDFAALRFVEPCRDHESNNSKKLISASLYRHCQKKADDAISEDVIFPFVRAFGEEHPVWCVLKTLCQDVIREVSSLRYANDRAPDLRMLEDGLLEMVIKHPIRKHTTMNDSVSLGRETILYAPCRDVRLQCRCAECIDEFSGKPRLNPRKVPADTYILSMKQSGNYAVAIDWSDGHHSLMAFVTLEKIFKKIMMETAATKGCASASQNEW